MSKAKALLSSLLPLATLLPGYVLCGMYWFEKIRWAPWDLFFAPVGPWGVFNLMGPFLAGISWILPGLAVTLVILHLLDPTAYAHARAQWRGEEHSTPRG